MTSGSGLERRVPRLENDRDALYELIDDFRGEFGEFRTEVTGRLDAMDTRFDAMDSRFDSVETTLAEVVRRLPEPE